MIFMQRYFTQTKKDNHFELTSDDIHHITNVMRMGEGSLIEVVYQERLYLCELTNQNHAHIKEEIVVDEQKTPVIALIIPFLKEQKMDLILQKGTELGVSEFIIIETERSIVKLDEKKANSRLVRWSKICKEASEQARRLTIPSVVIQRDKDRLFDLVGTKIICSPTEREYSIKKLLKNVTNCDRINIVIGPEGGFSLEEEIYFEKKGFAKVSLGTNIMRTETVPIFLSSIISYEFME